MGIDENKKIAHLFTERMGQGDSSALDEVATEGFVAHVLVDRGQNIDREFFRQTNDRGHRGFPDYSMRVDDMIAEGDKVMVLSTRTGKNTGEFINGIPPTGEYVEIARFALYRFEDGKIAKM
jgi:predicted ester cyclase